MSSYDLGLVAALRSLRLRVLGAQSVGSVITPAMIRRVLFGGLVMAIGAAGLYFIQDELRDVLSSGERLRSIQPEWFVAMFVAEMASFFSLWWLTRILLPGASWFMAAVSQLVSNSISRLLPGGAVTGGAVYFKMMSSSGISSTAIGGALTASSILSTAALVAIPAIAGLLAFLGAPIPESLTPAAMSAVVMFVLLLVVGAGCVTFTKPLLYLEGVIDGVVGLLGRLLKRPWSFTSGGLVAERDRLIGVVGNRWPAAVLASALNWAFDYLVLIGALYSVGAQPRLSLVLLAYAGAQLLGMIPVTPGGFGFVEVGLYSLLIVSGISAQDASLATIAYRMISFWVPIVAGLVAWFAYASRGMADWRSVTVTSNDSVSVS